MGPTEPLGDQLLDACRTARGELTLCAPFVKSAVLERALDATTESVSVELFTRWRPEEVAAGVSDTAVLGVVERHGGSVHLCDRLHAKFVRFDDRTLIGSANLTATALGWTALPNLELLVEVPADTPQLRDVEARLREESVVATSDLAEEIDRIAAMLPRVELRADVLEATPEPNAVGWYPTLRQPPDLYVAYSAGLERLARASATAAAHDLSALQVPAGLGRREFEAVVASRLLQTPAVQSIDAFLASSQRFGAVRDLLGERLGLDREEADFAWQTIMRWLLEFLPERYERRVSNWSEVLVRRGAGEGIL